MYATGSPVEISNHSYQLARLVYTRLSSWRHSNGQCLAELYHGASDFMSSKTQGPIVNFNLLRSDGSYVGFTQVNKLVWLIVYFLVCYLFLFVINVMFSFEDSDGWLVVVMVDWLLWCTVMPGDCSLTLAEVIWVSGGIWPFQMFGQNFCSSLEKFKASMVISQAVGSDVTVWAVMSLYMAVMALYGGMVISQPHTVTSLPIRWYHRLWGCDITVQGCDVTIWGMVILLPCRDTDYSCMWELYSNKCWCTVHSRLVQWMY